MTQSFHILKKDIRHLWLYIAAMIGSAVLVALLYPLTWQLNRAPSPALGIIGVRTDLVLVLLPLTSWILLVRIMQEEPLVGDKHFWLTRPYRWQQLIFARVLFYIFVIMLPVLLMQCWLLRKSELPVFTSLPALLLNLGTLSLFALPFATIAVVTRNFVQAIFTLIGICVYLGLLVYLASVTNGGYSAPNATYVFLVLLVMTMLVVIVVQFAARRTGWSRLVLGICLLIILLSAVVPLGRISVPMSYALSREPEISVRFDLDENRKIKDRKIKDGPKVPIRLPIESEGLSGDHRYTMEGIRIEIRDAGGREWNSGWIDQAGTFIPGAGANAAEFEMPRAAYERLEGAKVSVDMEMVIHHTFMGPLQKASLEKSWADLPALGRCRVVKPFKISIVECRNAVWRPYEAEVVIQYKTASCDTEGSQPGVAGSMWASGDTSHELPLTLTGVWVNYLNPTNGLNKEQRSQVYLCPGAQISVRRVLDRDRIRVTSHADRVQLSEYAGYAKAAEDN